MFARVLAVRHEKGGRTALLLRQAAVDEVLDDVKLRVDRAVTPTVIDADGRAVSTTRRSASGQTMTVLRGQGIVVGGADNRAAEAAFVCKESGGLPRSASQVWSTDSPLPLELKIQSAHAVHVFDAGGVYPRHDPYLLLQFSGQAVASVGFEAKTGFKCELSPTFRRNHRLHFTVGSIGPVPVSVNLEPTLSFEVSASGKVTLSQRHYFAITFERRGFSTPSLRRAHSVDPVQVNLGAQLNASLFIGGDLSVMLGGGYKSANAQAGLFGAFGPEVSFAIDTAHPGCVTGTGKLKADFGVRLELWVKRWNLSVASLTSPEWTLGGPWCGLHPAPPPSSSPSPSPSPPGPNSASRTVLLYGDGDFSEDTTGFANLEQALTANGFSVTSMPGATELPADLSNYGQIWHYGIDAPGETDQQSLISFAKAGGGVYLTGERPCCEDENVADSTIVNALVAAGGIGVGGMGDIGFCSASEVINQSAEDGVATTPNVLTTWRPECPGGLSNVGPANVFAAASDGTTVAALWDDTEVVGAGRLVILMDVNWAQSRFADMTTMPAVAQNLATFLAG
jgi:hypothetical protein